MLAEKTTTIDEVRQVLRESSSAFTIETKHWKKIDKVEKEEGERKDKVREKILSKDKMLEIAQQ